jgi:5-methyltetrahydrofolate--homocysteine methyltransferase
MQKVLEYIFDGIIKGDQVAVRQNVQRAMDEGIEARVILNEALIAAMEKVGSLFECNEFYVPEMLVSARAMKAGLEILRPKLMSDDVEETGSVIVGTVQGDLHDIGKKLVAIMLEGAGFKVEDLGVDIPPEEFVTAIRDNKVDILAMSALLTTTMTHMETTIKAIEEAGVRDRVKIIVGGAPVTDEFAQKIGADGFAPDASLAVKLAKSLLN